MRPDALQTLREVNDGLRSGVLRLRPRRRHCSTIKPEDFSNLLREVQRATECLSYPATPEDANALEKESLAFRSILEELKGLLPDVHVRLLAEKSRLETARSHLESVAKWAQSRKKSL